MTSEQKRLFLEVLKLVANAIHDLALDARSESAQHICFDIEQAIKRLESCLQQHHG